MLSKLLQCQIFWESALFHFVHPLSRHSLEINPSTSVQTSRSTKMNIDDITERVRAKLCLKETLGRPEVLHPVLKKRLEEEKVSSGRASLAG